MRWMIIFDMIFLVTIFWFQVWTFPSSDITKHRLIWENIVKFKYQKSLVNLIGVYDFSIELQVLLKNAVSKAHKFNESPDF